MCDARAAYVHHLPLPFHSLVLHHVHFGVSWRGADRRRRPFVENWRSMHVCHAIASTSNRPGRRESASETRHGYESGGEAHVRRVQAHCKMLTWHLWSKFLGGAVLRIVPRSEEASRSIGGRGSNGRMGPRDTEGRGRGADEDPPGSDDPRRCGSRGSATAWQPTTFEWWVAVARPRESGTASGWP